MDMATFGYYTRFIKKVVSWMDIQENDQIVDLGSGTGRNTCLMADYLKNNGKIVGLDIGEEMIAQFRKKCRSRHNVRVLKQRIDEPFELPESFDKALLCFVLHGFPFEVQKTILNNCFEALHTDGHLFVVDYSEFSIESLPWFQRILFKLGECPYAFEFVERDLKKLLAEHGFTVEDETRFFRGMVRCLRAAKSPSSLPGPGKL